MPSYTRGQRRDQLTYVKANPVLYYGFKTKDFSSLSGVSGADLTALGHITAPAAGTLLVIGANAPKPPRVSKRISTSGSGQSTVSTFCGYDKVAAALAAGWSFQKAGRSVPLRSSGRSVTAVVEISANGPLYCFPMNAGDFQTYGADLGLQSAASITSDAELNRLVVGSSLPKPGKATKSLLNGSTFSSFYAPEKKTALQSTDTWRVNSDPRLLSAAAAPAP